MQGTARWPSSRTCAARAPCAQDSAAPAPHVESTSPRVLTLEIEVGSEKVELVDEVLVASADDSHVADGRATLGRQGRDEVAEAAPQVGHCDVGAVQWGRPRDHGRLLELAAGHAAVVTGKALLVH